MRKAPTGVAALLVAASMAVAPASASAATIEVCEGKSVPTLKASAPAAGLTNAFTTYGNTGGAWTGGDSTYSVKLPGGRQLWLFSDTFLGTVNADGSRPGDGPIVNNTFVEQRGDKFRTIHGGTAADPTAVMPPPATDAWYWLGAGHLSTQGLEVVFQRYDRFGPGMWDWGFTGSVLARFDPNDYRRLDVTPLPSAELPTGKKVAWGSWISKQDDGYTYIYGVEDHGLAKYMHVARVAGDDLRSPWQFHTGGGWSSDELASTRITAGVANEYSVTRFRGLYMLITQDTNELFSTRVVAYYSCSPTGPFVGQTELFRTPETGGNIFTYNAHEHPELRRGDRMVVTYNVNSFSWDDVIADTTIYRPRFVEVTFNEEN